MKHSPSNLIRSFFLISTILVHLSSARVSRGDVERKVREIVKEHLGVDDAHLTADADFRDDLGADDLDITEMILAFEEAFTVEIPEEDEGKLTTIKSTTDYVCARACGN